MNKETKIAIKTLKDAVRRLGEGVKESKTELEKDGVVQRFEFTFELLWKTLRIVLEDKGLIYKTPKECLKGAFKLGLIEDEQLFLDMLEDRNIMSHAYDRQESERIYRLVKKYYFKAIDQLVHKLV